MFRRVLPVVVVWGIASLANATVVRRASLAELVGSSAVVLHGVVKTVDDDLSTSPDGPFRTGIELEVKEGLKGLKPSDRSFYLELPGGRAGDLTMRIPGMPRFDVGDEVVLLLEATARGYALAGLTQGVFVVRRDGGEAVVTRHPEGALFIDEKGQRAVVDARPQPLEALLKTLRALIGGAR